MGSPFGLFVCVLTSVGLSIGTIASAISLATHNPDIVRYGALISIAAIGLGVLMHNSGRLKPSNVMICLTSFFGGLGAIVPFGLTLLVRAVLY